MMEAEVRQREEKRLDLMGKSKNHTGRWGSLMAEDDGGGGEAERREKVG
jgi:hypothetical protein